MNKPLKQLPKFANEAEERAFWEANDSADYVDWGCRSQLAGEST